MNGMTLKNKLGKYFGDKSFYKTVMAVALLLSRLTDIPMLWLYVVICSLDVIKLIIGTVMFRSEIWCQTIVKP